MAEAVAGQNNGNHPRGSHQDAAVKIESESKLVKLVGVSHHVLELIICRNSNQLCRRCTKSQDFESQSFRSHCILTLPLPKVHLQA